MGWYLAGLSDARRHVAVDLEPSADAGPAVPESRVWLWLQGIKFSICYIEYSDAS
jgi:hypothetical protein